MSLPPPPTEVQHERKGRVRGVEAFQVGIRKGIRYTEKDIDDIVENFRVFSTGPRPLINPSFVIGHDEEDLKDTGIPSMGTPVEAWKEKCICDVCHGSKLFHGHPCPYCDNPDGAPTGQRTILKMTVEGIPLKLAEMVKQRKYKTVSAELYYPGRAEGVPTEGWAFRRLSALGGELPQVKSLKPLYDAQWENYGELEMDPARFKFVKAFKRKGGVYKAFSEVEPLKKPSALAEPTIDPVISLPEKPMNHPKEKADALIAKGFSADTLAKMSEAEFGQLYQKITEEPKVYAFAEMHMADAYKHLHGMGLHVEPSHIQHHGMEKSKESLKIHHPMHEVHQKMGEAGYHHMGKGVFRHHKTEHEIHIDHHEGTPHCVKYSESAQSGDTMTAAELATFSETLTASLTKNLDEKIDKAVTAGLAKITGQIDPIKKDVVDFQTDARRARIQSFCEAKVATGQLPAYALDRPVDDKGNQLPNTVDELMALDATNRVYKFSEAGKEVQLTPLEVAMKKIEMVKPRTFSEKIKIQKLDKDGKPVADTSGDDTEIEQYCLKFSENMPSFADVQTLKDGFKAAKAADPNLTPAEFFKTAG
jgi:hypothetical protein